MKTLQTALILLFSFIINTSYAQSNITYKGIIVDADSNRPISNVSIYCNALKTGTITNELGEFEINLKEQSITNVLVSHVSYIPRLFKLTKGVNNIIKIKHSDYSLPEVVVHNITAEELVLRMNKKSSKDSSNFDYIKGFYQKLSKIDNEYSVIHEFFFDAKWNCYGVQKWNITNARYGSLDSLNFQFNNFALFVMNQIGYLNPKVQSNWLISPYSNNNISHYYNFKILKYLNADNDNEIAVVSCTPKIKIKDKAYFKGNLFIKTKSLQLISIKGNIHNFIHGKGSRKFKNEIIDVNMAFSSDSDHLIFDHASIVYNVKLKITPVKTIKVSESAKVIFYQHGLKELSNLKNVVTKNDTKTLKDIDYDPSFWQNNTIVLRTPVEKDLIKSFESKNQLGNYFKTEPKKE